MIMAAAYAVVCSVSELRSGGSGGGRSRAARHRSSGARQTRLLSSSSSSSSPTTPAVAPSIVPVELGSRSYPIVIGAGVLQQCSAYLHDYISGPSVLVVTNSTVAPLYLDLCLALLRRGSSIRAPPLRVETVILPDGEQYKTLDTLNEIYTKLLQSKMGRDTTIIALGGGVIGDMAGMAAATYQRGIPFVQIPTTVMAMVDSSVGGKTAVNHKLGKNMIGAFHQPRSVLMDIDVLNSLPEREIAAGLAEVAKYGLIHDSSFFEWQEENASKLRALDPDALEYAIKRSCEIKAEVVAEDERERGARAKLNLGHTFGHAIEAGLGYGTLLHGEAVAIGTLMAISLAEKMGWVSKDLLLRTTALLKAYGLPTQLPSFSVTDEHGMSMMTPEKFMDLMAVDKKASEGLIRFILPKGPLGDVIITSDYDSTALAEVLQAFCTPL